MKLNYQQLEQHLNKTLASVYVVSGDELLMVNEAIQAIRDKALQQGFSERVRLSTENADWENYSTQMRIAYLYLLLNVC